MQMLQLGYTKFIQTNAKNQKVLWMLHLYKVKCELLFYRYAN